VPNLQMNSDILNFHLFAELAQLPNQRACRGCMKAQATLQNLTISVGNFVAMQQRFGWAFN